MDEFLRHIAGARGKLKRGGVPDMTVRTCACLAPKRLTLRAPRITNMDPLCPHTRINTRAAHAPHTLYTSQAAARIVLQDWNGGAIPFYTLPPSRGNEEFESAEVVAQWATEFDAEKVRARAGFGLPT